LCRPAPASSFSPGARDLLPDQRTSQTITKEPSDDLLGAVQATPAEWEAALIHSLDTWAEYRLNDRVAGDAVWLEVSGESRDAYRQSWIDGRDWDAERRGHGEAEDG
jgi:hypothetical protein